MAHEHPLSIVINDIVSIFGEMGFSVALGPEAEDEHHNFDALNIPSHHPARDMWDTFWLKTKKGSDPAKGDGPRSLLRTHTSPVQIRYMENHQPPLKIISPGKVFRYEATDATHEAQFYQVEGLYIGKDVSMAELKGVIAKFFEKFLGEDCEIRFRPSFFPFVEPGVEVDVKFKGKWLEVMGAGLVHPKVLESVGYDSTKWNGFAFGGGVDRFTMLKYGVDDVRLFYKGDLRLTDQF
jgi:phenylalanyl-tRNA synthetase alpha chain